MSALPFVLIFLLLCGIACAWFAASRHRNQAGWFLLGCLTGPIGVLILLLLPPRPESQRKTAVGRVIAGALIVSLIAAVVAAGAAEFWERYQEGERYVELENWEMYGDALIRFTKSSEHPSDAIVVKAAHNQISVYASQLREGMCWTIDDLDLAIRGVRLSTGPRGLAEYVVRLVTFRSPEWPAPLPLNPRQQETRVAELSKRLRQYEEYLQQIYTAQSDSTAKS